EEIFYAIQGEGILAGVPSVFLRLGQARCSWCTEPQGSWQPGFDPALGPLLTNVRKHWCGHAVLIGDEPLQHPVIEELTAGLREIEHHITIETSGAVYSKVECDLMSISPRLTTSTVPKKKGAVESLAYDLGALSELVKNYRHQIKFEVRDRAE